MSGRIDYEEMARKLKYCSESHMLENLYVSRNMSLSNIADLFNSVERGFCSKESVSNRLKELGIRVKPRGGVNNTYDPWRKTMVEFIRPVMPQMDIKEIARALGISCDTAYATVIRNNTKHLNSRR